MKIWPAKINRLCLALKLAPRELFPQSSVQNMPAIWLKASAFFFSFFASVQIQFHLGLATKRQVKLQPKGKYEVNTMPAAEQHLHAGHMKKQRLPQCTCVVFRPANTYMICTFMRTCA